jgi:hypothetical protein
MAFQVCMGATLQCSFSPSPSSLVVLPVNRHTTSNMPAANIMDHIPMVNIMPFGMCTCPGNPAVAAATAAALGTPTPAACIPATAQPWAPGSPTVLIANMPALNDTSKLICSFGGVISIIYAGQVREQIP